MNVSVRLCGAFFLLGCATSPPAPQPLISRARSRSAWLRQELKLTDAEALEVAKVTGSWFRQLQAPLTAAECAPWDGKSCERAVWRAIAETRDYLETQIGSSAPLRAFREASGPTRALPPGIDCTGVAPDPARVAVMQHLFELNIGVLAFERREDACQPLALSGLELHVEDVVMGAGDGSRSRLDVLWRFEDSRPACEPVAEARNDDTTLVVEDGAECQELRGRYPGARLRWVEGGFWCGGECGGGYRWYLVELDGLFRVVKALSTWVS